MSIMKTILVVEDNHEIREEISEIFEMENYTVLQAKDGLEGFVCAYENLPDLIISDIMMPVTDGYGMYRKLKNNSLTEKIPIIFLSALNTNKDIRKGMNLGADDYLTKPVSANDLIDAAHSKIEKSNQYKKQYEDLKVKLLDILHHELRTPLNGIVGFSDYLKDRINDLESNEVEEILTNICSSGKRLYELAEKYLLFAELKFIAEDIDQKRRLRMCEYINTSEEVYNLLNEMDIEENRKDDIDLDMTYAELKIDKKLFRRLMKELITNALKFSEPGKKISISSDSNNERLKIRVKNYGLGMKLEQIRSIDDFMQFNKKTLAQNGSGIGLSIVKMISKIYDADFNIVSWYGENLTAKIVFEKSFRI